MSKKNIEESVESRVCFEQLEEGATTSRSV